MNPVDFTLLLAGAGWIAAAAFAAALAGAPGSLPARPAAWLCAFGLLRATSLAAGAEADAPGGLRHFAFALAGAMLLWEAARQQRREAGAPTVSPWWHLLPLELGLLLLAVDFGVGFGARPGWAAPLEIFAAAGPAALGLVAVLWWWRAAPPGWVWRAPVVAAALAGMVPGGMAWSNPGEQALAWLSAAALGSIALAQPAARARSACVALVVFGLAVAGAPFVIPWAGDRAEAAGRADLVAGAEAAAQRLRAPALARLGSDTSEARELGRQLARTVDDLRGTDTALRFAGLRRLTETRVERLSDEGIFADWRLSVPEERAGLAGSDTFVLAPSSGSPAGVATVFAPLRATRFESPVAWLALEYPEVLLTNRIAAAHRAAGTGLVLAALLAAGVFVLMVRQAREAEQRSHLERARAADRAKTEFLAFLGHELRTPLQVILGRAEQLAAAGSPETLAAAGAINAEGRLMLRLVNDLLDLGAIEAGRLVLQAGPVDLRQLTASAMEPFATAAAQKNLACAVNVDPGLPALVRADEARLRQILGNLLGNAVKYTTAGGVELLVEPTGAGRVRFRVRDTGIGLPPDKTAQLFTLFTRLDSGATFTREGTGVGLALVKRLVDLMGGTVNAANRADGSGSEFTIELPLEDTIAEEKRASSMAPTALPAAISGDRPAVLVAEDHPAVGELLADHLRTLGFAPEVATNGVEAEELACSGRFAAVLIDINLPGLDGIALARRLSGLTPRPRLVGCSAEVLPATRAAALAAGMDDFLGKPVSLDDLRRALSGAGRPDLFQALRSAGDDRARELARAGLPEARAALAAAVASGDAAAIARYAHYLRNTALVLGDVALAAEAENNQGVNPP